MVREIVMMRGKGKTKATGWYKRQFKRFSGQPPKSVEDTEREIRIHFENGLEEEKARQFARAVGSGRDLNLREDILRFWI